MTYTVHETFLTLQGEGANVGRVAVFCRFAGCNLWTGREQDRASAVCQFCDTEFRGGEKYKTADALGRVIRDLWPGYAFEDRHAMVVLTGGEPLLQADAELLDVLHWAGFYVAVETNGTQPRPRGINWLTVSPKAGAPLVLECADELKLVYPQDDLEPASLDGFGALTRWLQPMDGPDLAANTDAAIAYCLEHPEWRLSVQTHKIVGLR